MNNVNLENVPWARFLSFEENKGGKMSSIVLLIAMVLMILLDQLTKIWAVGQLGLGGDLPIWQGVLHFQYLENRGAAWGIFNGKQFFLIGLTSLIIIGMLIYFMKLPNTKVGKWYKIAFVMIISGAIGNLIDRVFLHYVRDFIYFKLIDFPIFNVADIFVVCGVILLMVVILLIDKSGEEKKEGM